MLKEAFSVDYASLKIGKLNIPGTDAHVSVIDNFFAEPEKVVWLANELDYTGFSPRGQFKRYIGERATISLFQEHIVEFLAGILSNAGIDPAKNQRFPTMFTKFKLSHLDEMDVRQFVPHVDSDASYSVVCYFCDRDCRNEGGTFFYKHRKTGLGLLTKYPTPHIAEVMRSMNFSPFSQDDYLSFVKSLMYTNMDAYKHRKDVTGINASTEDWEVLLSVKPKFNRLVIFPSLAFHSPVIHRCEDLNYNRLTYNLFLK